MSKKMDAQLDGVLIGGREARRMVIDDYRDFRDWLRMSGSDRALYAATKKTLSQQQWSDLNYYAEAKSAVVQLILGRVRDWRATRPA
ncbi:GrpB family protein [Salinibacterium sp.]|uniref:GrpB family protein n=1 Tax=Salinibacterium sp. TaxID=1915057 RepID=UPI00286C05EA|nr:GrpB family protein [Salinibacterium sp.]